MVDLGRNITFSPFDPDVGTAVVSPDEPADGGYWTLIAQGDEAMQNAIALEICRRLNQPQSGDAQALASRLDEGVLAEALERALRDAGLSKLLHASMANILGRHMAHHIPDVAKEFATSAAIEAKAREIYEAHPEAGKYPWVPGGNSLMQDEARVKARQALADATPGVEQPATREHPEPPWPIGPATNCKRTGWTAFFEGRHREACPFPSGRADLQRGYREGWDAGRAALEVKP